MSYRCCQGQNRKSNRSSPTFVQLGGVVVSVGASGMKVLSSNPPTALFEVCVLDHQKVCL